MHVVAFAPASRAAAIDAGGLRIEGFPMTRAYIDTIPKQIIVPIVFAAYTQGGSDYEQSWYVAARSPEGDRAGIIKCEWEWPDNPGAPFKYRVFALNLPMMVQSAGVYTIGLYDEPESTETAHQFPMPVTQVNPLLPPPQSPPPTQLPRI